MIPAARAGAAALMRGDNHGVELVGRAGDLGKTVLVNYIASAPAQS